ncbi:solute carrier family 40 member 1-like [Acanthaster planci]|uniref:Solute carrier family 40 member 1-like n=1 Tax=Acanthaster planci TaxID=133434 RepID=A0A8B7Y1S3_ACAPL|nr:solute carrier family 40 member 1-like [Acanthaster planci]XP_022087133.1 solute carrier family 40 member 1-like [Acanthaster planci]
MADQKNEALLEDAQSAASSPNHAVVEDINLRAVEGKGPDRMERAGVQGDEERQSSDVGGDTTVAVPDNHDNDASSQPQGRYRTFAAWITSNAFLIYCSQFFSAWGDRMWTFAVALYLVEIEEKSLRLTAIFGFALTVSVLLFGALVGQWVDKTPRLSAARKSLVIQNSGVIINAVCLLLLLHYKSAILAVGSGALFFFCQVIIIVLGVVANLASVAEKICIQKDWVVILAGDDSERLAEMNATVRRIDLTVNILAPILVGQIMTFASMTVAGIFIAAWNLGSLMLEYYLLVRVYRRVPRLAIKFRKNKTETAKEPESATTASEASIETNEEGVAKYSTEHTLEEPQEGRQDASEDKPIAYATVSDAGQMEVAFESGGPDEATGDWRRLENESSDSQPTNTEGQSSQPSSRFGIFRRVANWFVSTYQGWLIYKSYKVCLAGLGLAFLYMTVMGFDSITNGYGYSVGLSEVMLGVIRGLGSIAGIVGTFLFPRFRQRIGLTRTGLYSLSIEILCLTLCVFSIWAAGSPFDPDYFSGQSNPPTAGPTDDVFTTQSPFIFTPTFLPAMGDQRIVSAVGNIGNDTGDSTTQNVMMDNTPQATPDGRDRPSSYLSAVLFFTGMVTSRIGLWMFDLVTTQLIQENVHEDERGVFNGVQRSLECSMDMLHFILVIILPAPETFGYLIILSFIFICIGAIFYCVFSFKDRGHLFHPEKLTVCLQNGQTETDVLRLTENESEA